ncbi:hypothetical protein EYC80_009697 [Monilinia laxa]|uniref:Uncharacterized protein n=1 Tax=Monilinia laxa TaxID=61186 RepID=A0A5N6JYQ3_MONLA|nr:hypothetical protein EYC80_009697 [Monilinia laxa]
MAQIGLDGTPFSPCLSSKAKNPSTSSTNINISFQQQQQQQHTAQSSTSYYSTFAGKSIKADPEKAINSENALLLPHTHPHPSPLFYTPHFQIPQLSTYTTYTYIYTYTYTYISISISISIYPTTSHHLDFSSTQQRNSIQFNPSSIESSIESSLGNVFIRTTNSSFQHDAIPSINNYIPPPSTISRFKSRLRLAVVPSLS